MGADGHLLVPCRTCGREHRVDTACVATEECRRAVDDVLWRVEVEAGRR